MSLLNFTDKYTEYLRDESRLVGRADSISFPESPEQLRTQAAELFSQSRPVTVQGARTGICGAAVPTGGHILNLSRLNRIQALSQDSGGNFSVTVQPGVTLGELKTALRQRSFDTAEWSAASLEALQALKQAPEQRFLPNPTEESATFGGLFCCNAKGINACIAGPVADQVAAIELLLPDGSAWQITRGEYLFDAAGRCPLPDGRCLELSPVTHPVFDGLCANAGSDLIDFFAASEGMLGIITSLTLRLCPMEQNIWGIVFFFAAQSDCSSFIESLLAYNERAASASLVAAELFDTPTLTRIAEQKKLSSRLRDIPDCPPESRFAVYCEVESPDESALEEALLELSELFVACGGNEDDTWAACGPEELEKFRLFRHTAPESANVAIDLTRQSAPEVCKVCADYTLPPQVLTQAWLHYQQSIDALQIPALIFGHILSGRLHINFTPQNAKEQALCRSQLAQWAEWVLEHGGKLFGENGIGKLKAALFLQCADEAQLKNLQIAKKLFDPDNLLNPGNMQNGAQP